MSPKLNLLPLSQVYQNSLVSKLEQNPSLMKNTELWNAVCEALPQVGFKWVENTRNPIDTTYPYYWEKAIGSIGEGDYEVSTRITPDFIYVTTQYRPSKPYNLLNEILSYSSADEFQEAYDSLINYIHEIYE